MNKITQEIMMMSIILIISFFLFSQFDVLEKIVDFSEKNEEYEIDEIMSTFIVFVILLLIFSFRRWGELVIKTKDLQNALN